MAKANIIKLTTRCLRHKLESSRNMCKMQIIWGRSSQLNNYTRHANKEPGQVSNI